MLKNIGIIGEGKMGTNLLYYLLDMDFTLTWICSTDADLEKIKKSFNKRLNRSLEAGIIDETRYQGILDRITISAFPDDLASCELIIEAICENLEAKRELFRVADRIASPDCILTSNSSSINPSRLVPSDSRKERFAGLHFFYPIGLKDIVEIIVAEETSKETLKILTSFLKSIGRRFLILEEKNSFILNRIFLQFQNDAFLLVKDKKASFQQIDRIVREHFFPTGVFEFFDSVGLDVMLASIRNYSKEDPDEKKYKPLIGKLEEFVSAGLLGLKTKGGFYTDAVTPDPGYPENDATVIETLRSSYTRAFRRFQDASGIPPKELKSAMDEYFGSETPPIF
jgi:3-hydroxyacyl-CoA dehydrogenase